MRMCCIILISLSTTTANFISVHFPPPMSPVSLSPFLMPSLLPSISYFQGRHFNFSSLPPPLCFQTLWFALLLVKGCRAHHFIPFQHLVLVQSDQFHHFHSKPFSNCIFFFLFLDYSWLFSGITPDGQGVWGQNLSQPCVRQAFYQQQ